MLSTLITSCIRGLGPFWQNLYAQYGDSFKLKLDLSSAFIIHFITKSFESMHQHVAHINEHHEACL
jgi:hypothetical protein